jgi:hypothetical protein
MDGIRDPHAAVPIAESGWRIPEALASVAIGIEGVRHIAAGLANLLANFAAGLVQMAFAFEVLVARQLAGAFLNLALDLLADALDFLFRLFFSKLVRHRLLHPRCDGKNCSPAISVYP